MLVTMATLALAGSLGAAGNKIEVAHVIDQAMAETILDTKVKTPTPLNLEGRDGYYSKCNYYSVTPGRLLILRFYLAAPGFDAGHELDHVRATSGSTRTVTGLGDKAELCSGPASGFSTDVTMLYVLKDNALITIGVRGLNPEPAVEKAKSIAQKILEQL
jgi:hypothetical protein